MEHTNTPCFSSVPACIECTISDRVIQRRHCTEIGKADIPERVEWMAIYVAGLHIVTVKLLQCATNEILMSKERICCCW